MRFIVLDPRVPCAQYTRYFLSLSSFEMIFLKSGEKKFSFADPLIRHLAYSSGVRTSRILQVSWSAPSRIFLAFFRTQVRDRAQIDSCYPPENDDDTGNLNPVPPAYLNPGLI